MESLIKLLELSEKHALAALLTILFILFLSDKLAADTPLSEFRSSYESWLWVLSLFFCFLCCIQLRPKIDRYLICPAKKLLFPKKDFRTGIKQSRFRMEEARLKDTSNSGEIYYRGSCSNGITQRYYDSKGKRVPLQELEIKLKGSGFVNPGWSKIDWEDVFNGDYSSGTWAIHR